MYKGKFNKKSSVSVEEIVAQRNAAPAKKKVQPAPVPQDSEPEILRPRKAAPQPEEAPVQAEAPRKPETPKKQPVSIAVSEPKMKKGPRIGGVIFYTFWCMYILLFFAATYLGLQWLQGWLIDYEKAQPTAKAQQVYDQVFANPDWATLYNVAGVEDSQFVGKEEYVAHMEQLVGSGQLTYQETSAGLSGGKKYLVYFGEEKVAAFTLTGGENAVNVTDIPEWTLGTLEVFFDATGSVRVQKVSGHTVKINGVALDDSYTIQIATTKAEEYLPEGTAGLFTCIQEVTGLLGIPTVEIYDENGNQMEVIYDEEKNLYIEQTEANVMTEDQKSLALDAVQTYALWMIEEVTNRAKIAKYFDPASDTYDVIISMQGKLVIQDSKGYEFVNISVSDYCRYSDTLYSLHVSQTLNVTRTNGTIKEFPIDCTLFFHEKSEGKWLVYEMVMEDVTEPVGKVRLTFTSSSGEVLFSDFVRNDATTLTTPVVSAPAGKVFSGWVREGVDAEGNTTWTVMFTPDENGNVTLPSGTVLEPMTLFPLFENASEGE